MEERFNDGSGIGEKIFFRFMIKILLIIYSDNLVEVLDYVKQSVYITYLAFGKTINEFLFNRILVLNSLQINSDSYFRFISKIGLFF